MITMSKSSFVVFSLTLGMIFLVISAASAQTSISCGQTVTGSISGIGATNEYNLDISANDRVSIRATKTGGNYFFNPYLELYAPNGSKIANAAGQIDAMLAVAGYVPPYRAG